MSHAPKQRALEAYAALLLSPAARTRVDAHLARCAVCRDAAVAIDAYAVLRTEAAEESLPEPSWEPLERALDPPRPAAQRARGGRAIALAWPLLALAASVLIAWLGLSGSEREAAPNAQHAQAPRPEATVPELIGRVTLIAGWAQLSRDDHSSPIDLNTQIREGSLLVTQRNTELHVVLGPGTGFVLGPESRLRVAELRAGRTRLELVAGQLANRVAKLEGEARYAVATGDIVANVRGTRFEVEQAQGTRVVVHEGLVEVSRGSEILALLSAGQSYEAPRRSNVSKPPDVTIHALEDAFSGLRALHLPAMPELHNWRIDGAVLSAQGSLSMRVPPGPMQLSFEDVRGQVRSVEITVSDAEETRIDPLWLARLVAPREVRSGHLEPEQIAQVIRAALDPLRRCYERSLRHAPSLEARLKLAVRVGPDGRVQRADVTGAGELPEELERCIAAEASRLLFPKPVGGGSMAFEVPLNLKAK